MTALVVTVLAVLVVAGPLLFVLTHHRQENPMPTEIHYLSPNGGMLHAVADVCAPLDARSDWAKVTCPACLVHKPKSTDELIAGLAEEPKVMTVSHDRLILQRADQDGGHVVVVKCPHTIGLCFELEDGMLGLLPCPCNDRSEVLAEVVARTGPLRFDPPRYDAVEGPKDQETGGPR